MWTKARGRRFEGLDDAQEDGTGAFFTAVVLADTQFGFGHRDDSYAVDIANAERAVEVINRVRPRFAVVCGDLINMMPEIYPHLSEEIRGTRAMQVRDFKRVFEQVSADIPLVCVCGNHDVGNRPNAVTTQRYKNDFGDDYFSFVVHGVCFVAMNTNVVRDPTDMPDAYAEQFEWLERVLLEARDVRHVHQTVLLGHHPVFIARDDEPTDDPSLGYDHLTDVYSGAPLDIPRSYFHLPLEARTRLLELLARFDVRWFFSGHYHRNLIARSERYNLTNVISCAVGRSLSDDPVGYRLVAIAGKELHHRYFPLHEDPPDAISMDLARSWE